MMPVIDVTVTAIVNVSLFLHTWQNSVNKETETLPANLKVKCCHLAGRWHLRGQGLAKY
jgi:hypothetical protein